MASAEPTFPSKKETTHYSRLCCLLVDVGSQVLREVFENNRRKGRLDTILSKPPESEVLEKLRENGTLSFSQWQKLHPPTRYPMGKSVSSDDFDITLLMVLLRNICDLFPPATEWDSLPSVEDTTLKADIIRIICYRNTVYRHGSEASIDDATFSQYWEDIQAALVRLGGGRYKDDINDLKNGCIKPEDEKRCKELLKQWVKDEVSVKERLDEIKKYDDSSKYTQCNYDPNAISADCQSYLNI